MTQIRQMLADILECPPESLTSQSGIGTFPGWDSFAHLNIMMGLERDFGIQITDETIEKFSNFAAIENLQNSKPTSETSGKNGVDNRWEDNIYGRGQQLNTYPFPVFIGHFLRIFGNVANRKDIYVGEVGCGAGNNIWFFAREGFSAYGIDGSVSAINFASNRLSVEGLHAKLSVGDFKALPWPDKSLNFVLDRAAITHNSRDRIDSVVNEVLRVLKPGGYFFSQIFSTEHSGINFAVGLKNGSAKSFTGGYFANIALTFFADRKDITEIFENNFNIVFLEHETGSDLITGEQRAMWNILMTVK